MFILGILSKKLRPLNRVKVLEFLINFLLVILIFSIPLRPKWGSYALILLGITGLIKLRYVGNWKKPDLAIYFLFFAFLVRLVWLVKSNDFSYGVKGMETELPLVAVPLVFSLINLNESQRTFYLRSFAVMAACIMLYSFIQLFEYVNQSPYTFFQYLDIHFVTAQYYAQLNMLNWNNFAHYSFLSVIIIYGLHALAFNAPMKRQYILLVGIYILLAIVFFIFTGSRTGLGLMIVSLFTYCLIWFRKRFSLKISLSLLMGVIILIVIYFISTGLNVKKTLYAYDPQRVQFFVVALDAFKEAPFLGYGTGSQQLIMHDIEAAERLGFSKETYEGQFVNHPHNQFLTELIQFGIIGSIPLFIFLITIVRASIRDNNWALLNIMIAMLLFMCTESPINSNKGIVPFMVLISLLANRQQQGNVHLHEQKME
jgi:O-antigen ligase